MAYRVAIFHWHAGRFFVMRIGAYHADTLPVVNVMDNRQHVGLVLYQPQRHASQYDRQKSLVAKKTLDPDMYCRQMVGVFNIFIFHCVICSQ